MLDVVAVATNKNLVLQFLKCNMGIYLQLTCEQHRAWGSDLPLPPPPPCHACSGKLASDFSHPSVTVGDWFQDPLQTPEPTDAQVPYTT